MVVVSDETSNWRSTDRVFDADSGSLSSMGVPHDTARDLNTISRNLMNTYTTIYAYARRGNSPPKSVMRG